MLVYYFIFFAILYSVYTSLSAPEFSKIVFIFISVSLVCLVGFRGVGVSRDMYNYLFVFDNVISFSDIANVNMEPMAVWIPVILKYLNIYTVTSVFFVFACLAIIPKMYGIYKISPYPILSCLILYSTVFFRLDFTQIRAAAGVGLFFWGIKDIYEKNWKVYFIKIFIACLFHTSSLVYAPLYFLNTQKISKKSYILVVICAFFIGAVHFNIFAVIPGFSSLNSKMETYIMLSQMGVIESSNILSYGNIINLAIVITLIIYSDVIRQHNKYAVLMIKFYYIGLVLFAITGPLSIGISGRLYDLFVSTLCVTILYLTYIIRPRYVAFFLVILYCFYFAYQSIVQSGIVAPYFMS